MNQLTSDYLQCLFTQRHVNDYNLRNLEGKLSLPKPNANCLKRSFCCSGACLWNNSSCPKISKALILLASLNGVLRRYLRYRIPATWQLCKTVVMSFSFLTFSLTDDSPCLNRDLYLHLHFERSSKLK